MSASNGRTISQGTRCRLLFSKLYVHMSVPGKNHVRGVLKPAEYHGDSVRNMPPNSSLEAILSMEDLNMSPDGDNNDGKNQRYHGRILTWLVHHSNGWWNQLSKEEKASSQVLAADEFRNQFANRDLPEFDVTSSICLPIWGPHEEFEEMEIESYNRAQELLHFLYDKATSSNTPEIIWGNDPRILDDTTYHDASYKPTWMLKASQIGPAKNVEENIQQSTLSARTLKLIWQEEVNYTDDE
ncbi:hypothetical protein BDV97DRAFT_86997 [Delphinella strobiligena]|nr:hypothetical protein BDV97DRAFT_86997 [Delphinella strobiligena]